MDRRVEIKNVESPLRCRIHRGRMLMSPLSLLNGCLRSVRMGRGVEGAKVLWGLELDESCGGLGFPVAWRICRAIVGSFHDVGGGWKRLGRTSLSFPSPRSSVRRKSRGMERTNRSRWGGLNSDQSMDISPMEQISSITKGSTS